METIISTHYLKDSLAIFTKQKAMAEKAIRQLSEADLHQVIGAESNSVAVIMKHMAGNMRSRWTDFLNSDGEKSWRQRDQEFIDDLSSEALWQFWEAGWQLVLSTMNSLNPSDLLKNIYIRDEAQTVMWAIERQKDHYAYHVGQIVYLTRHLKGENWKTLSIPKGESETWIPTSLREKWQKELRDS
ncbi:MAG: DinB family protein [Deinococcales bacterium]